MTDTNSKGSDSLSAFLLDIWKEIIEFSKEPTMKERTILVDTNYLTQITPEDFVAMFLDSSYEENANGSEKKQMAKLFRDFMERKVDLVFTDIVMREFIGLAPKRRELLEIYKKNIVVITPKKDFEPCFFDLAAAINACIAETGEYGDIKDTYSYILCCIANVRYFVTEDPDVKRVHLYIGKVKNYGDEERKREIRKITGIFKSLQTASREDFPLKNVLHNLFLPEEPTVPISIKMLEERLPKILDRCETIMWMFRSLDEINHLKKYGLKNPEGLDETAIERARKRIEDIGRSVGLNTVEEMSEVSFHPKILEGATKWTKQTDDEKLAFELSQQIGLLNSVLYADETEKEYASWEDEFNSEEVTKTFLVKCDKCNAHFEIEAYYEGVVEANERAMGTECCHQWSTIYQCPTCSNEVELIYELWEYPAFCFNSENIDCNGCELIREQENEKPSTTLDKFTS